MAATNAANAEIRPTEAQLRWAHFHSKRRAYNVQRGVERMYQTPRRLDDVPGALPEDGNSTTSISDAEIRQRRPKVSRGRRAMLRVSKREYEKRKKEIQEFGYMGFEMTESISDDEEDEDIGLNEMFTSKRRRPTRRKRGEEEPVVRGVCTRRRIGPDHRGLGDHETRGLRTRQIAPGGGVQQR